MTFPEKYHVPFVTALWMIVLPPVFWFFAGAGAGTVFHGLAGLLDTMFSVFGGPSLIVGFLLLGWSLLQVWRDKRMVPDEA